MGLSREEGNLLYGDYIGIIFPDFLLSTSEVGLLELPGIESTNGALTTTAEGVRRGILEKKGDGVFKQVAGLVCP